MPQRQYSKKQTKVTKKNRRIILPVTLAAYNELKENATAFRQWLEEMIKFYPELLLLLISLLFALLSEKTLHLPSGLFW